MFGLDEITWKVFIRLLIVGLLSWYLGVLIFAWLRTKTSRILLFEEATGGTSNANRIAPISVFSKELPSQLCSAVSETEIAFEVLRYEESDENDGLNLNLFLEENNGELIKQLPKIQHQH